MTLPIGFVTNDTLDEETLVSLRFPTYSKTHSSLWTLSASMKADRYVWIEEFTATHPAYGTITAKLDKYIECESEEAYQHFLQHHPLKVFCYSDI